LAFALAVDYSALWQARVELQVGADAASYAAALALVDEDLLIDEPSRMIAFLAEARTQAQKFSAFQGVQGQPLSLNRNEECARDGDILFGTMDLLKGRRLTPVENLNDSENEALNAINTVRILACRLKARGNPAEPPLRGLTLLPFADVAAASTATLDRDIVGFRPLGTRPLPIVPLAVLSDPTGENPASWESQIEDGDQDNYRFDRDAKVFVPGQDQLPELEVQLACPGGSVAGPANGAVLTVGIGTAVDLAAQVLDGITAEHLQSLGRQMVLDANNQLLVSGLTISDPSGSDGLAAISAGLMKLQATAEKRVWPLYRVSEEHADAVVVAGFVAARVVQVQPLQDGQPLTFTLQPTMMAVSTAVTDPTRRGVNGAPVPNPYVVKVRLVE
jgi:hypothetical protein